jgi:myo-inositol 2-dehydrogenase / D-chiro-inositol 1-dehydrogenase
LLFTFTPRIGVVISVFLSRGATYGYDQRCEVFGTSGHVRIDNVAEHTAILSDQHGVQHSRLAHSFPQRFALAFEREMDAFVEVLLSHRRHQLHNPEHHDVMEGLPCWPVTRSQCVHVQRVTDAAIQSVREGRVISLVY